MVMLQNLLLCPALGLLDSPLSAADLLNPFGKSPPSMPDEPVDLLESLLPQESQIISDHFGLLMVRLPLGQIARVPVILEVFWLLW